MPRKNDMQRAVDAITKIENASPEYNSAGGVKQAAHTLIRPRHRLGCASTLANGTTNITPTGSPAQHSMPADCRVLGVYILPSGALTADPTNNATIALKKADGTVIATINTSASPGGTGNWVAGTRIAVPVSATSANFHVAKGVVVGPSVTQNGAGVATPAFTLEYDVELEAPADDYTV